MFTQTYNWFIGKESLCKGTSRVMLSKLSELVSRVRYLFCSMFPPFLISYYKWCQRAKLCAGIKPTALCSAFDKENLIEFPLDFLHYLYNYYMVCALFSHAYHVTRHVTLVTSCDVTL